MTNKRTWKFASVMGEAGDVMRASRTLAEAATRLGVDRQTIHRWAKAGKIPPPGGGPIHPRVSGPLALSGDWAKSVRTSYALSPTESVLVELADTALTLARDPTQSATARLAAAGRFQLLVRQLNLEVPSGEAEAGTRATWPREVG